MDHYSLRVVRNAFFLGQYERAMKEAAELFAHPEVGVYARVFSYRALAMIDPASVFGAIDHTHPTSFQAIKQYATFRTSAPETRDLVISTIEDWLSSELTRSDPTLVVIAAYIYVEQKNYHAALRLVVNDAESLERLSLCTYIYLLLDRVDLAAKTVKAMQDLDDDDVLTQLSTVWLCVAQAHDSRDKITEAENILQGLQESNPPSAVVLNGLGVCALQRHAPKEAFQYFKTARDTCADQRIAETFMNSLVALTHLRAPAEIHAKVAQEMHQQFAATSTPYTVLQQELEAKFDQQCKQYKWKVAISIDTFRTNR